MCCFEVVLGGYGFGMENTGFRAVEYGHLAVGVDTYVQFIFEAIFDST